MWLGHCYLRKGWLPIEVMEGPHDFGTYFLCAPITRRLIEIAWAGASRCLVNLSASVLSERTVYGVDFRALLRAAAKLCVSAGPMMKRFFFPLLTSLDYLCHDDEAFPLTNCMPVVGAGCTNGQPEEEHIHAIRPATKATLGYYAHGVLK